MNPSNIGGGRSKLPRSIRNLLTVVHLDEYDENELKIIVKKLFLDLVSENLITDTQVDKLFEFYLNLRKKIKNKDVGKVGGPYEVNLRDFTKLHDILKGNFKDQQNQHAFTTQVNSQTENKTSADFDILVIQKFLELIFAKQFQKEEDQEEIKFE